MQNGTFIMAAGKGGTANWTIDNHGNPGGFHTLQTNELAPHTHLQQYSQDATTGSYPTVKANWGQNIPLTQSYDETTSTGDSTPFDIRPPSVTAHIWKRTA